MNPEKLSDEKKAEILRDAYKKHSTELLAIEEAQQKLTLMLLGILGAGGSFVASVKSALSTGANAGLTVIVVAAATIGLIQTYRRNQARTTVRALLVRCEMALGFHSIGVFIPGEALYESHHTQYAVRGRWLAHSYWLVPAAAVGFLMLLWIPA